MMRVDRVLWEGSLVTAPGTAGLPPFATKQTTQLAWLCALAALLLLLTRVPLPVAAPVDELQRRLAKHRERPWSDALPTDADILHHAFTTYLDAVLPPAKPAAHESS